MVKPRYLLDTNILSEPLRPQPNSSVMKQLERHYHEVATAAVVWYELRFGCCRLPVSRRRQRIEQYLNEVVLPHLPLFPYDQAAADWHAEERAVLKKEKALEEQGKVLAEKNEALKEHAKALAEKDNALAKAIQALVDSGMTEDEAKNRLGLSS